MRARTKRIGKVTKVLMLTAGATALAYIGGSVLASWILVRPGKRRDYDCIPDMRFGRLEPLTLWSRDGVRLHAWMLRTRKADPDNWVLLLHGYRSSREAVHNRARFFARRGFNVLLLHFRGHGGSDRALVSYGYHERWDVKAAFDFILSLAPEQPMCIGIDAISMGAAAAAYAVGSDLIDPDWMILESCYDNIQHALSNRLAAHLGSSLAPLLAWPIGFIVEQLDQLRKEDLDPAKALERARCPILVMAGDSEVVLKTVEIEYFFGCIPEPKQLVIFQGAGHEDLLMYDTKRYARAAGRFFRAYSGRFAPGPSDPLRCNRNHADGAARAVDNL